MHVPRLEHWLSGGAWTALLPTVLTAALGVVALPSGLSDQQFFGLLAFAVLATLVVWWNAVRQAERAQEDRRVTNDLLARLSDRTEPKAQDAVADLRHLSSHQLREKVNTVSQHMRDMERTFHDARNRVTFHPAKGDWDSYTSHLIAQSNEQTHRWRTEGQPEAVALWNEMRRRIYGAPPYPRGERAEVALEHGMLAGVAPLNEAALHLEELARQLP